MTDDGHHDDGRKRVSTWWYVHLLQLAAIEPRARDRFDMEEEEAASVLRALAQTPVEQCIELRGDQSTWLHDALGNKWGDDWRDGRWMRWDGRRKTYLQWFLAYLRYQRLPESGIVVCHSCGCPWCIRLEHIRYDTKDEDQKDKDFHGAAAANRLTEGRFGQRSCRSVASSCRRSLALSRAKRRSLLYCRARRARR